MVDATRKSNRRSLDPSLSDGTPLGTFVLDRHPLGAYSGLFVEESSVITVETIENVPFTDTRPIYSSEAFVSSIVESVLLTDTDTVVAAETFLFIDDSMRIGHIIVTPGEITLGLVREEYVFEGSIIRSIAEDDGQAQVIRLETPHGPTQERIEITDEPVTKVQTFEGEL